MVWTATLIHYADRELPEQRAELYNAYVDVLLGERLHEEESAEAAQRLRGDRWSLEDRRLYLTYAAYEAHRQAAGERTGRQRDALVVVDERDLVRRILAPFMADYLGLDDRRKAEREAADFVALMAERSGLLHAHEEGYSFGDHLTVQEFLTASYLVDDLRDQSGWAGFLQNHAGQTWWREVFLLAAGYLLRQPRQARRFLLDELGDLPGDDDARAYGLAWAGRALLEIPPRRVGWHANARDELARRLLGVLWQNPPTTSAPSRVEAGDVLGRLGDPRFQGQFCLPEFLSLPGGRFWMGSNEAEVERLVQETGEDWFKRELPRHQVELDAFALARYPATNATFACFMEAGGYAEERWWDEAIAGGYWSKKEGFRRRNQPYYWDDARFNGPNQPVVGVAWYEAVAYCCWLTTTLDDSHEYRLPTEAEWERAARGIPPAGGGDRGGAGRRYPWGDEWAANRANTEELNLRRTAPVGIFPDGASAERLLDLCGNVWEWCSDWYHEETYRRRAGRVEKNPIGPAEGSYKVLRGGSWYSDRNLVRRAYRDWGDPVHGLVDFGFRVARGSPSQIPCSLSPDPCGGSGGELCSIGIKLTL